MALDSLRISVSDYTDKKADCKAQQDDLNIEIEKADDLVASSSGLDQSVQQEIKKVRDSFGSHQDELKKISDDLEKKKIDIQREIDTEQKKLESVQKKIDALSVNDYSGNLGSASERIEKMLAELDDMLAELAAEKAGGAAVSAAKAGSIVKINGDSYRVDDNGKPHMKRGDDKEYHVLPNTKYTVNGYTYQSDDNGRIIHVEGNLAVKDGKRASLNAKVSDMKANDQRGHIIADIFGGSNRNDNLIAQMQPVNQGLYKILESSLADMVLSNNQVHGNYTIEYGDDSSRPSAITVNYSVNGGTPFSQMDTFLKLGLQDTDSFAEFEKELILQREHGHSVECNYSVIFSNTQNQCWLVVEHTIDSGYPIITQFL